MGNLTRRGQYDIQLNAERFRKSLHHLQCGIPDAPFDSAQVGTVHPGTVSQVFLTDMELLPMTPQCRSKSVTNIHIEKDSGFVTEKSTDYQSPPGDPEFL